MSRESFWCHASVDDLSLLNERALWDFEVARLDGGVLVVLGSNDFTYRHNVEITFRDVTFSDLPSRFSHAWFTFDEERGVAWIDSEGTVYTVRTSGVDVKWETVSYV